MSLLRRTLRVSACLMMLGSTGCVSLLRGTARSYSVTPNGLNSSDDAFRRALMAGSYENAFKRAAKVKEGAPDDKLLRALYRGTTGFHAGDYRAAAMAFAEADRLAVERETRSLSHAAASLVTNDRVIPYLPSRTERLFIPYYAMLSYLRAGDRVSAGVEARRLGLLLQASDDSIGGSERAMHAVMRDAAGAVFESLGEINDALVSYRNAAKLRGATPQAIDSIAIAPAVGDSATLVVFVESGFVAHRASQQLTLDFSDRNRQFHRRVAHTSRESLDSSLTGPVVTGTINGVPVGGAGGVPTLAPSVLVSSPIASADPSQRPLTAPVGPGVLVKRDPSSERPKEKETKVSSKFGGSLMSRLSSALSSDSADALLLDEESRGWRSNRTLYVGAASGDELITPSISVAWPVLVRTRVPQGSLELHLRGSSSEADDQLVPFGLHTTANVSDAIGADLRRAMPMVLTRMVLRAAAKAKIADAMHDEYGWFAGALASFAGDLLEVADTRSWQLLPARLEVVRVRVPAGLVAAQIQLGDDTTHMDVRLSSTTLRAGETFVTSARIWRDQSALVVGSARNE